MKKIAFLMLHLNYGGLERQVTTLANNLVDDYEIEIISLYDLLEGKSFYKLDKRIKLRFIFPYGPNKEKIFNCIKKLKFITLVKELTKSFKLLHMKYFGLKKIIDKLDTDILISSRIEFANQIQRNDIITISQEHSYIDNRKYMKKCIRAFKDIKYLVVMTKQAKDLYEKWLKRYNLNTKVVVIPNMINENLTDKVSTLDNNQIVSIGRLEEVKDFKTLITMFSVLVKYHSQLTLKIIGEGSQRKELENLIKEYNIEDSVILTGRMDENQITEELLKSDVFILTSKSESFSLVLCEAMSYGVPCVAFDIDVGPREIIENGKNGFIVENRDISAMIKKIDELLSNRELRINIGKNAYDIVNKYYPYTVKELWKKLF